jgi:hypothetical protein
MRPQPESSGDVGAVALDGCPCLGATVGRLASRLQDGQVVALEGVRARQVVPQRPSRLVQVCRCPRSPLG